MTNDHRVAAMLWLLQQLPRMGPMRIRSILENDQNLEKLAQCVDSDLDVYFNGQKDQILSWCRFMKLDFEKIFLRQCESAGVHYCTWNDPDYPECLRAIADAPPVFFYRGHLQLLRERNRVAIVGTRQMSLSGKKWLEKNISQLVSGNVVTVSGLARGIDAVVHEQTLAAGGLTIAVTALGVDGGFPKGNRALHQKICQKGLVLSEWLEPPGNIPADRQFPRRNRMISGLVQLVVVIEASLKSGALVTARLALEQGRDVMAMPGDVLNPVSEGSNKLLQDGAGVVLSANDILETLGIAPLPKPRSAQMPLESILSNNKSQDNLSVTESKLMALCERPVSLDDLVLQLDWPAHEVMGLVTRLELAERLRARAPGIYEKI